MLEGTNLTNPNSGDERQPKDKQGRQQNKTIRKRKERKKTKLIKKKK